MRASVEHEQENYSTAGTDPFEGTNTDEDSEKDEGGERDLVLEEINKKKRKAAAAADV